MSGARLFRCPKTWVHATSVAGLTRIDQERRCEDRRWHTGWHHATWTWYPPDGSAGEYRTVEWSGEPDHPFERETVYPTLGMFARATPEEPGDGPLGVTTAEAAGNLQQVARSGLKITPDEPARTCPTCGSTGPGARVIPGGCEDAWHYTLPQSTIRFEVATPDFQSDPELPRSRGSDGGNGGRVATDAPPPAPTPLMKAHLALIRYGRHENACPWSYPPIAHTVCTCGLAEAIRKSCTNIEAEH